MGSSGALIGPGVELRTDIRRGHVEVFAVLNLRLLLRCSVLLSVGVELVECYPSGMHRREERDTC